MQDESGSRRANRARLTFYDFPGDAVGKAIPYGIYDVGANDGFVSVGTDHDTPVFAVTTIEAWCTGGLKRYPDAREIFITADAGGSNSSRSHVWKQQLQRLADKLDLSIHGLRPLPPGTSKWNAGTGQPSFISVGRVGRCAPTRRSST